MNESDKFIAVIWFIVLLAFAGAWLDENHPLPEPPCECTCDRP